MGIGILISGLLFGESGVVTAIVAAIWLRVETLPSAGWFDSNLERKQRSCCLTLCLQHREEFCKGLVQGASSVRKKEVTRAKVQRDILSLGLKVA
jgi:hypothetical protein